MNPTSAQLNGFILDRDINLMGLDKKGNVAVYAIQADTLAISTNEEIEVAGNFFNIDTPLDFSIKAKVRTMYALAAFLPKLYKGWGDEIREAVTRGGGTIALIQAIAGGPITVTITEG